VCRLRSLAFDKNKLIDEATRLVQKGALDKAIKIFLKIVEEDPKDVRIWLKLGDLYAKRNEKALATETYLKVAEFYAEQGFYLKSVAVYKQILKLDTRLVEVNLRLAELYRQLGLLQDAMQQYELVSQFYNKEGRVRESLAALRQIVELDPENVAIRIKLAELYSKEGLAQEAVDEFTRAADFLRAQNRSDDLLKVLERLSFHKSDDLDLLKDLARQYLERGDPPRALVKLQGAFKNDPRDEETLSLLARAFVELGQTQKAISVLRELAHLNDQAGRIGDRNEAFERLLVLQPTDPEALVALGRRETPMPVMPRAPVPQSAAAGETPHLDADERLAHAHTEADVYVKYGLHGKAVEHLMRVFDWAPNNVPTRQKLKDVYLAMERPAEAVEQLIEIGRTVMASDPCRAAVLFNEALDLDATHEQARGLLAQLEGRTDAARPVSRRPVPAPAEPVVEDVEPLDLEEMAELTPDELGLVAEPEGGLEAQAYVPEPMADDDLEELDVWEEADSEPSVEDIAAEEALDLSPDEMDLFGRVSGSTASDLEAAEANEANEAAEPLEEFEVEPASSEEDPAPDADYALAEPAAEAGPESVEDEIEEVDFFLQQSLYDEARDLLLDLAEQYGDHPLIAERLAHIEQAAMEMAAAAGSPVEEAPLEMETPEPLPFPVPDASVTVEDLVHEVKRAARGRPSQEDPEAHHLLGAAYHEMGDYENALREFEAAIRLGGRQARYLLAVARTLAERKQLGPAAEFLREALRTTGLAAAETLAINFELGIVEGKLGDATAALHHFEKVAMQEPNYRDVRKRLDHLRGTREPPAGADEFDRAFEDVFSLPDEKSGGRR